jgi:hypothetical protein
MGLATFGVDREQTAPCELIEAAAEDVVYSRG